MLMLIKCRADKAAKLMLRCFVHMTSCCHIRSLYSQVWGTWWLLSISYAQVLLPAQQYAAQHTALNPYVFLLCYEPIDKVSRVSIHTSIISPTLHPTASQRSAGAKSAEAEYILDRLPWLFWLFVCLVFFIFLLQPFSNNVQSSHFAKGEIYINSVIALNTGFRINSVLQC